MVSLKRDAVVPLSREVGDGISGQHGVDPGQHQLPRLSATVRLDLVAHDEVPDQTENQLHVAGQNVLGAYTIEMQYNNDKKIIPDLPDL